MSHPSVNASSRPPSVVVLDYGMGNLRSVCRAFEVCGATVAVADDPDRLSGAEALVFPGQGAIVDCMKALDQQGWAAAIREWIAADRPFFGICLGLQALFEHSEEGGTHGLCIFPGRVRRFQLAADLKVPHMGWNRACFAPNAPLTDGLHGADYFYFVHSYYVESDDPALVWCETEYGRRFVSGIHRSNCFATQFHPEKSQAKGLQIYKNFLQWVMDRRVPSAISH